MRPDSPEHSRDALMLPTAVLLDFDGVIADAENHHVAAWQRVLTRLGWEISDEVAARFAAIGDHRFAAELFADRGIDGADVDGWVNRKRSLALAMIGHAPPLFPGAVELIQHLEGRARLAVVAHSAREFVETLLDRAGLAGRIDVVVAAEDVDAAAVVPAADSRRLALSLLEVAADRAVAVEGSAEGLAAARVAGARPVAVGHRLPHGDWTGDAPFLPSLEPISDALARLGFGDPNAENGDRETR